MDDKYILLTPKMVEERFHIKKETLNNWRHKGTGPRYHKPCRKILYRLSDLDDWLDRFLVKTIDQS